jgi:class 3 adenylate cyclase
VARLDAATRAKLPDSAFAYVDSAGKRHLPIYDDSHVRNALARFNQVRFESDGARDAARTKLLKAAKRHRIVPVGFIDAQLRAERGNPAAPELPTGFVTMLMTDIEGSTEILDRLGDRFGDLLDELRDLLRSTVGDLGCVVEARADELFAVFATPRAAVASAVAAQRELAARRLQGEQVRVRVGIHSGYPTRRQANYIGMPVHLTARVCNAAHGGQVVVTGDTRLALTGSDPLDVGFTSLGTHRLRGIPGDVPLHQVVGAGLARRFPPPRTA